ncbi:YjgN family protein [Massilia niastensis]|uniref:YjgN family protein n=1 Tax=Massilia niastensis TaxID=544911 RepID=UPI00036130A0|nr:YjgN family protein [Massilia niastensis]
MQTMPVAPETDLTEPLAAATAPARTATFTGSGREYFRIWVVNLLLTLATCGIYSAWAKVRRLQYFDRNTQLAGACFDFRGDPKAILRGRILALALLGAYHYAFGFSLAIGIGVLSFILLALPFLLRGALRFRLANTQYRGLNLGFDGSVPQAYLGYLGPVAVFLLPGLLVALFPDQPEVAALAVLPYLAWPALHAWMKAYQHRHLLFGDRRSAYAVPVRRFYRLYLGAGLVGMAGFVFLSVLIGTLTWLAHGSEGAASTYLPTVLLALTAYAMYLVAGPFMQVRVANLVWSNTRFPGVRIRSSLSARDFVRLQAGNALLTVLTLGLYRPFAVVRAYRYRIAHTFVEFDGGVEATAARMTQGRRNAAGDGAADALGIDLSW